MSRVKHFNQWTLQIISITLVVFGYFCPLTSQCYLDVPDDRESCTFSCINAITEEEFQSLSENLTNCKTVSLYLSNGNYTAFSPGYFSNLGNVKHFFLEITNVIFDYFPGRPDEASPFANITFDTSAILMLVRVKVTESWNWSALSAMQPIRGGTGSIEVYESDMIHLSADFRLVLGGSSRIIRFSSGNLQTLEDEVFSSFSRLQEVYLHKNQISEMKREYFPNPANMLETLVLQSNKLESLPIDMFLNMPKLKLVSLSNNEFKTIDEVVFRPIAGKVQLDFSSTTLHCDCDLRWLKYVTGPEADHLQTNFFCNTPTALKGMSLENVTEEDLGCDNETVICGT